MNKIKQWCVDHFVIPKESKMVLVNDNLRSILFICPLLIVFGMEWISSTILHHSASSKDFIIFTVYYSCYIFFSFAIMLFALTEKRHPEHKYNRRQAPTYFMFVTFAILCSFDMFITNNSIYTPFIFYCAFQIIAILLLTINPVITSATNIIIFAIVIFQLKNVESIETLKNVGIFALVMCFLSFYKRYLTVRDQKQKIQLQNALDKSQTANIAKTKFLSSMSHDIRTPMNAVMGFTDLIQTNIDNKEQTLDYLDKIKLSSEHLLNLINDILDLNKIETGNLTIENHPISLDNLIDDIQNMMDVQTKAKNITFKIYKKNIQHNYINCDVLHVKQIMFNLLGNALKYTEKNGEISFTIEEKENSDSSKCTYVFTVLDNGIGMSKDIQKNLFKPYARDNTYTVENIQGDGLGMAITKNLVDLMNGDISLYSRLNVGTRISVTLTFDKALEKQVRNAKSSSRINSKKLVGKRILLVDDNELNLEIASSILSNYGIIIDCAKNGQIAVDKVLEKPSTYYDLILMDVQMPILNGYEATKQIRSINDANKSSIPIIAMTANALEEDKKQANAIGMSDFVSKPFNTKALLDVLNNKIS